VTDVGARLKAWRRLAGFSQEEAGKRVGVSAGTWCYWEAEEKLPGLDLAPEIEAVTGGAVRVTDWVELAKERRAHRAAERERVDTDPDDPPTEDSNDPPSSKSNPKIETKSAVGE
jgi:transcriptional regulator with XRE-family HTH domain